MIELLVRTWQKICAKQKKKSSYRSFINYLNIPDKPEWNFHFAEFDQSGGSKDKTHGIITG